MPSSLQSGLKSRGVRRIGAGLALLAVVAVVFVIVSETGSSPAKRNTGGKDSAFDATTVKRRDLVQTDTESGTLSYASPQTVYNRLSGTLTWLPGVGRVIKPGEALFRVDGKPVILMNGTTPAYRDLASSDSAGKDIEELNRNLVALGFNPDGIVVDDEWQAATTAGVEAFQASLGETQTGSLSLGQIVFLPGDQLVSTVDATLGSTGGGSGQGNPSSSSNASYSTSGAKPEFVSLEKPAAPKHGSGHMPGTAKNSHKHAGKHSMKSLEALIALLQAEVAELKAAKASPGGSPSHGGKPSSNSGQPPASNSGNPSSNGASPSSNSANPSSDSGGGSATAILETTSTRQIVTVDLDPSKQSEAKVGERVSVEMPAGNTVDGRVSSVSPVAQASSNSGNGNGSNGNNDNSNSSNSGSTIPVTITLSHRHAGGGLDQAAVSVNFAQARANHVLSVPVTALLATAGGGYAVQAAAAPHQLVPVTTGLFAAGYVQISGRGIYPGLRVTDSQG
ncbi:MAG TPA: peptidoglycan-binding domain-containing protein [Solirubrobacteraceae bacterium]|nr:peptidoglycan-binding domain-containing protein [Solirubrobacteraceae bacterium]